MPGIQELSERELEILRLVARGASNKQIAQELYISANTVKVHLRNIFSKIDVTSRTEAAIFAMREGLIEAVTSLAAEDGLQKSSERVSRESVHIPGTTRKTTFLGWILLAIIAAVVISVAGVYLIRERGDSTLASEDQSSITVLSRWQERAELITPRKGLAVATYGNQIIAIGGENENGVTNAVEIYDPLSNRWIELATKPLAVADVSAATIGGLVFVPGGRLTNGNISHALEVYVPVADRWEQRAPLPTALSAYTLVPFEGKLYVFGGWNGQAYVNTTYEYDPATDNWNERYPMDSPRGYAGGTAAGGKIYIIGGLNGQKALDLNEVYQPDKDDGNNNPWTQANPLPEARYAMGIANVADIIHVIGGISAANETLTSLVYSPRLDNWERFDIPYPGQWSNLAMVPLETQLYALGGLLDGEVTSRNLAYQAIYTVLFPVVK